MRAGAAGFGTVNLRSRKGGKEAVTGLFAAVGDELRGAGREFFDALTEHQVRTEAESDTLRSRALDTLDQSGYRELAHALFLNADGRDRGAEDRAERDVVEAEDRDVSGDV